MNNQILYHFIYEFIDFISVHDLLLARSVFVYLLIYFVKCIWENPLRLFGCCCCVQCTQCNEIDGILFVWCKHYFQSTFVWESNGIGISPNNKNNTHNSQRIRRCDLKAPNGDTDDDISTSPCICDSIETNEISFAHSQSSFCSFHRSLLCRKCSIHCNLRNWPTKLFTNISILCLPFKIEMRIYNATHNNNNDCNRSLTYVNLDVTAFFYFFLSLSLSLCFRFSVHIIVYLTLLLMFLQHLAFMLYEANKTITHFRFIFM